jgi:hypothetical protein
MRKVILSLYMTLEGVMEEPAWTVPYGADDIAKFKFDERRAAAGACDLPGACHGLARDD